jgi:dihydroflavonol-4-reductase
VLRAAREAGVKRVIITSSTAAVAYGHPPQPFDETSWTNLDGADVLPYVKIQDESLLRPGLVKS